MTTYDGNGVAVKRCCAACQRGSRAYGQLPCGRGGVCACHRPQDAPRNDQDAGLGLVDGFEKQTSQIGTESNGSAKGESDD